MVKVGGKGWAFFGSEQKADVHHYDGRRSLSFRYWR